MNTTKTRNGAGASPAPISDEFAARLNRFAPSRVLRVIVFLNATAPVPSRRPSRTERQATVNAVQAEGAALLADVDQILECHGGRRLSETVSALGTIAVETTPDGVRALAATPHVRAVIEDQPVSLSR